MDYGYPQFTEAQILQEFIKTDSYRMEVSCSSGAAAARAAGVWTAINLRSCSSAGAPPQHQWAKQRSTRV